MRVLLKGGSKNTNSETTHCTTHYNPLQGGFFSWEFKCFLKVFFLSLARSNLIHRQQPFCTAKNHFDNAWIEKCALGGERERKIGFHFVCKESGVDVIFCSKGFYGLIFCTLWGQMKNNSPLPGCINKNFKDISAQIIWYFLNW